MSSLKRILIVAFHVAILGTLVLVLGFLMERTGSDKNLSEKNATTGGSGGNIVPEVRADVPAGSAGGSAAEGSGGAAEGSSGGGGCGEGSSSCCFRGRTLVAVGYNPDGSIQAKAIEDIRGGETVLGSSFDGVLNRPRVARVKVTHAYTFDSEEREFVNIVTASGATIEATATHPFVVSKAEEGIRAQALSRSHKLFSLSLGRSIGGTALARDAVLLHSDRYREQATVYHLKTESENFFVSNDGARFFLVLNGK